MSWPQWTVLTLFALNIILTGFVHGVKRTGEFNVGVAITNVLIMGWLLWMGGFFGG